MADPSTTSKALPWYEDAASRELAVRLPHVPWLNPRHIHGCALPPGWMVSPRSGVGGDASEANAEWISGPSPVTRVVRRGKGACLVASRDIAAGEVVLLDEATLVAINDLSLLPQMLSRIPTSSSSSNKTAKLPTKRNALRCAAEFVRMATGQGVVLAQGVTAGTLQWTASLIFQLLSDPLGVGKGLCDLPDGWCGTLSGEEPAWHFWNDHQRLGETLVPEQHSRYKELLCSAECLLQLLAPTFCRLHCAPQTASGAAADQIAQALTTGGLHRAHRLAALFDVLACNAVEVRVPGVPDRMAVFPLARLLEHECRPACVVSFVDSPITHGWLPHVAGSYAHRSDPVYGPMISTTHKLRDHHVLTRPSIAIISAVRGIKTGDPISISYAPTAWLPNATRQTLLQEKYFFSCKCCWCERDAPDIMRAFKCAKCERGEGAVCPKGDGSKLDLWECVQCGYRPDEVAIGDMLEREATLSKVKADKALGLTKLLGDDVVHFSHWLVLRKLDEWSEVAWRAQDSALCINILETLVKCCDRAGVGEDDKVLLALAQGLPETSSSREDRRREGREQPDATKAQYLEFLGKVHHAIGNAHTSRDCYRRAYLARVACGKRLTWWCRVTRFMAEEKSLADLMDGK